MQEPNKEKNILKSVDDELSNWALIKNARQAKKEAERIIKMIERNERNEKQA